jgi:O-antigen/teichoic acid export membrane protein
VREQLSTGARLSPYFLFLSLNLRLDVLLLAALANSRQVGVYSVAVLIAELVWMPTWALAQATKEQQAGAEPRAAAEVTARALRMTLVVSVLLAAGLALVAPPMVLLLFGSDFESAIAAIWVLLPASVAMAVWRLLSVLLARLAPIRVTAGIALAAVLSNCLLNLLLIPALGIIGAALASVASYGCGAALALNRFKRIAEVPWRALLPGGADIDDLRAVLRPRALRRRLAELRAATGG